jgi:hypothetical protein
MLRVYSKASCKHHDIPSTLLIAHYDLAPRNSCYCNSPGHGPVKFVSNFISRSGVSLDTFLTLAPALPVGFVVVLSVYYARSPWRGVSPGPMCLPVLGHAPPPEIKPGYSDRIVSDALVRQTFFLPRGSRGDLRR